MAYVDLIILFAANDIFMYKIIHLHNNIAYDTWSS